LNVAANAYISQDDYTWQQGVVDFSIGALFSAGALVAPEVAVTRFGAGLRPFAQAGIRVATLTGLNVGESVVTTAAHRQWFGGEQYSLDKFASAFVWGAVGAVAGELSTLGRLKREEKILERYMERQQIRKQVFKQWAYENRALSKTLDKSIADFRQESQLLYGLSDTSELSKQAFRIRALHAQTHIMQLPPPVPYPHQNINAIRTVWFLAGGIIGDMELWSAIAPGF
jgi:hypothetical protein